jgi:TrkA domain protein
MEGIRESDLPGIGKKIRIETKEGDELIVIIHAEGVRELYYFDESDPDEAVSVATLSDTEARQLAAIIGGMSYQPKSLETIEMALDDLVIEWVKIEPGFKGIGKTIVELNVRQQTGVNILAVLDKHKKRIISGVEGKILPDTTLIVTGDRQQIKMLKELLLKGE